MQRTGIESIDKFFRYGETETRPRLPFSPRVQSALDMFQSEYTEGLHDRKAAAMLRFCEERPQGFFYEEVAGLTQLVRLATEDLFKGVEEMAAALVKVLAVDCADPGHMFNRNAGSDELRYVRELPPFLDSLEPLIRYPSALLPSPALETLRQAAVDYLRRFAERQIPEIILKEESFEKSKGEGDEVSPVQVLQAEGTRHLRALLESRTLEAIVELLFDYRNHPRLVFPLL
ncbi:unnamed protein product [Sphagnum balticum]